MNTFIRRITRDLSCVFTASVITLVVGIAFVQSTAVPPGTSTVARIAGPAPLYT